MNRCDCQSETAKQEKVLFPFDRSERAGKCSRKKHYGFNFMFELKCSGQINGTTMITEKSSQS